MHSLLHAFITQPPYNTEPAQINSESFARRRQDIRQARHDVGNSIFPGIVW